MPILKLSVWYDSTWWVHFRTKGNWHRRAYWGRRQVTWATGQYTFGPFRLEVNLTTVNPRK